MITVHHLEDSRSLRILWLLEELGVKYEIKSYPRDKDLLAPSSLRAIHPLGKSPVITDGDKVIAESGAIVDYLMSTYGDGRLSPPPGTPERLRYTYWIHYADASAMPALQLQLVFTVLPIRAPWLARPLVGAIAGMARKSFVDPQVMLHANFWESELGRSPWFAGEEFTAADAQMSFPLEAAVAWSGIGSKLPRTTEFLGRIHSRPAYARALERTGHHNLASFVSRP
jgi:glutathione S-transferase